MSDLLPHSPVSCILQVKTVVATCFARPEDVPAYFDAAVATLDKRADRFVDYFESTYIGRQRHGRRTTPMYAIDDWNCHQAVTDGFAKTNNALEGFNRRLSTIFVDKSRNLWRFLQVRTTFPS